MPTFAFPKPPMTQSIMDAQGIMSPQWLRWFNQVFAQIENAAYIPANVAITGGTIGGDTIIDTTGTITTTAALHAATAVIVGALTASNFSGTSSGTNTGNQTIDLTGDVTGTGTGSFAATIGANKVTYAKFQQASAAALLGASAAGNYGEITASAGLRLSGTTLKTIDAIYDRTVQVTGFSYTIPDNTGQAIIEPAAGLATGTVTMPATPQDGDRVGLACTQAIVTLTMNPNSGQTLKGGLAAITANGFGTWQYRATNTTWYRVA